MTAAQATAIVLALILLTFAGFALFNDNPLGGEPMARVAYDPSTLPGDKPSMAPVAERGHAGSKAETMAKPAEPPGNHKTITIIDGSNGARQDVVVRTGEESSGGAVESAPTLSSGVNPRLLENSRYGMIPVAAGDLTPFRAYAAGSDADRAKAARMPSIAIVVTGLGVGAAKTQDAIVKLPAAVTLAFTPYGADPAKLAERARAARHELLLQIPMEPFDYPDNDPGPQTLLTSFAPEQIVDRLNWHLGRIQGYVGLANFMGARFVVSEAAMQQVLAQAQKRGLAYMDDGSSPRSVASRVAEGVPLPFARADAGIDTVPTALEIDRALARLESIARERGTAVGVASALPISVERISIWARGLESRGILLVPLTTVMLKSKSS